ncbi:CoA pyrophosphatase [Sphingomonas flavalba]|uniref:CoA pyrophosphatase n=1 Tax=Sphingomonas flavalba TaxID=2559804 RepID=UPI00109E10CE|nr:CoA pyrophosphatase [Sphingomonas flavalba]
MTAPATPLADRLAAALATARGRDVALIASDTMDLVAGAPAAPVPAAVLVAITERPDPGVILTRRTATLRQHAGQIALPGGRIDPADTGPVAAALREAEEEIALPRAAVSVIGTVDPYRTVTGFDVTPVVGVVPPDLPLHPSAAEVESWFEVPLAFLLEPRNQMELSAEWRGRTRHYHEIVWNGHRIWGATAAMLVNLGRRLAWPI